MLPYRNFLTSNGLYGHAATGQRRQEERRSNTLKKAIKGKRRKKEELNT